MSTAPVTRPFLPEDQSARLGVVTAALLFSTGGAAVKASALGSWQIAGFRCGLAAVALVLLLPASRRDWTWRTLTVALAYAATMVFYVVANKLTTAANTIFLQYTAPLYVLLLSPWFLRERIRRRDLLFMVALALGMATFFVGLEPPSGTAPDPLRGKALAALTGLCWGLTLLGLRWLEKGGEGGGSAAAVLAGNLLAFLVCLPAAFPTGRVTAVDAGVVIYLGVVQIALAYVLLTSALRRVRALEVSLLLLLELIFNPFWAWLLHRELPGGWPLVGCGMILAATVLWTAGGRRRGQVGATAGRSNQDSA